MYKKLLAILFLLSVSIFSCSACFADDMVKIGGGGTGLLIYVNYQDTLPDGRMIFSGRGGADFERQRARLLCVNPDGAVSWEYVDQDEKEFYKVVVLEDGNIAVRMKEKVVLFTPDGKKTGREVIPSGESVDNTQVISRGLLKRYGEKNGFTEFIDWDGNFRFRTDGAFYATLTEDDGLVMTGRDPGVGASFADAIIMKIDWQGNLLWKKILPSMTEERGEATDISDLDGCFRTSDGCYLAVHKQHVKDYDHPNDFHDWREYTALIKFSADGEILWETQPETGRRFEDVAEYEGKYCVSYYSGLDIPGNSCYLWLDADGNELGTTVRSLNRQEIPGEWYGRLMRKMQMEMIPSKEGLWQNIQIINENLTSAGDNYIMSVQQMLVRVPEL